MSKRTHQRTEIIGTLLFNLVRSDQNSMIWCQECGSEVTQIEFDADRFDRKLVWAVTCERCRHEADRYYGNRPLSPGELGLRF